MAAAKASRYFSDAEYDERRRRVREEMSRQGLDACIIASPENIYYLTGLDHMGYFACQLVLFPVNGQPILITRAMEKATVRDQVPDLQHVGYSDGAEPVPTEEENEVDSWARTAGLLTRDLQKRPTPVPSAAVRATVRAVSDAGLGSARIGIDMSSTFLPWSIAEGIMSGLPDVTWYDLRSLIDDIRIIQSKAELALTRQAAEISDAMMLSSIAAAGRGIHVREIMAAIYDAMFRRGSTYPGFVPLVRSSRNLDHEHGTWDDSTLRRGDRLFLEMAGCVRRYHAPMGRLVYVGKTPANAERIDAICREAQLAAAENIRDGALAGDVYENWQAVLDRNRLSHYSRHHCGYSVGIGYPPSWSGSGVPVGLRRHSDMRLREGMVFHLMSWLLRSGQGDAFLSDTILVTREGCEFLTTVDRRLMLR